MNCKNTNFSNQKRTETVFNSHNFIYAIHHVECRSATERIRDFNKELQRGRTFEELNY